MKFLLVVILSSYALAMEENEKPPQRLRRAAVTETTPTAKMSETLANVKLPDAATTLLQDNAITVEDIVVTTETVDYAVPTSATVDYARPAAATAATAAKFTHKLPDFFKEHHNYFLDRFGHDFRDKDALPMHRRPDICATGTIGRYRPREGATTCAIASVQEKPTMKAANAHNEEPEVESAVNDPRNHIFDSYMSDSEREEKSPFRQEGYYRLQVKCDDQENIDQENIDVWYEGTPYQQVDQKIFQGWDKQRGAQSLGHFGYEPISAPDGDLIDLNGPDKCYVGGSDCQSERMAACEIHQKGTRSRSQREADRKAAQKAGEDSDDLDEHAELIFRLEKLMVCNTGSKTGSPLEEIDCKDGKTSEKKTKISFYSQEKVEAAHLKDVEPNGINLVPESGGGASNIGEVTQNCINYALETMCLKSQTCGKNCKCGGQECDQIKFCSDYAQKYKDHFKLIHQERGAGVPHTNSEGKLVASECVDPTATWISLLWEKADPNTPSQGAVTVFGCPSADFSSCDDGSIDKCKDKDQLPFKSWKGWLTTSKITRTNRMSRSFKSKDGEEYNFCTLWHQLLESKDGKESKEPLKDLLNADLWADEKNPTMKADDEDEFKGLGYLQPQTCVPNEDVIRKGEAFNKCVNLSPDNCHFRQGTKFDTKFGQFYHEWNASWQKEKWWFPRFGDTLDWKKMLPVCFGCDHEGCDTTNKSLTGGTCKAVHDSYREDPTHKLWWWPYRHRSPVHRMSGRTSGASVVRDQGGCGSCWAFASMSTVSHLTCIADCKQNGRCMYDNIILGNDFLDPWVASAQQILSCNRQKAGCWGGWMKYGDEVYQNFGVMKEKNFPCEQAAAESSTNGAYNNAGLLSSCKKYYNYACKTGSCQNTVNVANGSSTCNGGAPNPAHLLNPDLNICQNQWGAKCPYSWDYHQNPATPGYARWTGVYNVKRVNVGGWYNVASGSNWEADYKNHLYHTGPFGVAFDVYTDFPWNGCSASDDPDHVYTVGSNASKRGGHGVTMVGYGWAYNRCTGCNAGLGCKSGWMKYWLLQNSWGRNWGDGGYWRHRRGTNEARIESWAATAPEVDVNCNEKNKYYGGRINYPRRWHKYPFPKNAQDALKAAQPSWMTNFEPEPAKSEQCEAANWNPDQMESINGFDIIHDLKGVERFD